MATSLVSGAASCIASVSPNSQIRASGIVSSSSIARFAVKPTVRFSSGRRLTISSKLETPTEVNATDANDGLQLATSSALAGILFSSLANASSAQAAQEVMELAASDNRGALLFLPIVVALGWVGFNIFGPAVNQFNRMKGVKAVAAGLGLAAASALVVPEADAAEEIMQLAASDNRGALVLAFILPALGWVLFNIAGPAQNQFSKLLGTPAVKKRGIAGALGLGGASLLLAPHADAAEEIMQLAASDNRGLLVLAFILPALGWVLFNIAGPAKNQFDKLFGSSKGKKGSIAGILGLGGASLLLAPQADAAEEIMQLAASDNRGLLVLAFILPALGWVLYNIGGPALNQWNKLTGKK